MKLNDEQNVTFMNDPRRVAARKNLDDALRRLQANIRFDGSANYYLTVLPQCLQRLSEAYENLNVVEATVEAEILGKERYHG